jgi:N-acetylated-alpha-linked acidic dipeptidase
MHGSGTVTAPFDAYFQRHSVSYEYLDAGEVGSDHLPFRDAGVPVAGLHCGSIGIKTPADQERYGGAGSQLYDPGYHQASDTVRNISRAALDWNVRAMAYAVGRAAEDASDLV